MWGYRRTYAYWAAEGKDGATEGSNGATKGSEGATKGDSGATRGCNRATKGSEGATEGCNGATKGSEIPIPRKHAVGQGSEVREGLPDPVVFSQLAVKASAAQVEAQARAEAEKEAGEAPPQPGGMLALTDSTPVAPPHACAGCVCDPFVAVRFLPDQRLRLFRICDALRVEEISDKLPEDAVRPVICASIYRGRVQGHSEPQLLLVVPPGGRPEQGPRLRGGMVR
ncbi:unnamed protein product [Prorocentrum cordatum]|uniref:Uncharacterized protein n=1 Tax=Prorocentrum cordatum TaxID=2364126 RepID=A0ABN9PFA3_9DINO|nr:unnamed protein product [Polarella glacialis]